MLVFRAGFSLKIHKRSSPGKNSLHTAKEGRQREDGSAEEKRFLFIIHIFLFDFNISIY